MTKNDKKRLLKFNHSNELKLKFWSPKDQFQLRLQRAIQMKLTSVRITHFFQETAKNTNKKDLKFCDSTSQRVSSHWFPEWITDRIEIQSIVSITSRRIELEFLACTFQIFFFIIIYLIFFIYKMFKNNFEWKKLCFTQFWA